MARVVSGSSRHIISTTVTTFGGFLPLILGGGAFWPPFAVAIAGGVLLSTVVSFYFTPPVFALVYRGRFGKRHLSTHQSPKSDNAVLRLAAE
jgi:preprotein translocase subunit SecF